MPRMDGLTLLGKIQEAPDPVATVIVSAYGDMSNIRIAMNRGAFDFLTKPIDFADLEMTIAKTLRHVDRLREAQVRRAEAERAQAALARYFSPNLAAELATDRTALDLSGRRREVTAMFTDVAGFTGLVESLDADRLAELLNRYFSGMTEIVFSHGGTVAKVMGDAMHVLFGAPTEQHDHAARAVACALDLDAFAETFRSETGSGGSTFGLTRIGLHAGLALVGDFGGGRFFDYTAYGDTINTASRLEAANKTLGTRICVSDEVATRIANFDGRPIGDLALRGRSTPLRAHEPRRPGAADRQPYMSAFQLLCDRDPAAISAFAALVGIAPEDPLANLHLRRLLNGERGSVIVIS
jgi:adenylate cyclase